MWLQGEAFLCTLHQMCRPFSGRRSKLCWNRQVGRPTLHPEQLGSRSRASSGQEHICTLLHQLPQRAPSFWACYLAGPEPRTLPCPNCGLCSLRAPPSSSSQHHTWPAHPRPEMLSRPPWHHLGWPKGRAVPASTSIAGLTLLPMLALRAQCWCGRPQEQSHTGATCAGPMQATSISSRALLGLPPPSQANLLALGDAWRSLHGSETILWAETLVC